MSLEDEIRALRDRQEIRDLMSRYARGADRLDFDLIRSCYHPDASDDHGVFRGDIDGLIAFLSSERGLPKFEVTSHLIHNHNVELEGDVARAETYCIAVCRWQGEDTIFASRYLDRLERRRGRWAISRRVVVYDWGRRDPVGPPLVVGAGNPDADVTWGRRDRGDLSYGDSGGS